MKKADPKVHLFHSGDKQISKNDLSIIQHKNCCKGEIVYVVGSGHSLHNLDLTPIHQHPVITVNSGILLMPWNEAGSNFRAWLTMDAGVRRWDYYPKVKQSFCHKITKISLQEYYPHFHYYHALTIDKWNLSGGLLSSSSIIAAIHFALFIGGSKIKLVGADHYINNDGKSHFYEYWEHRPKTIGTENGVEQQTRVFRSNEREFKLLNMLAKDKGATIVNCSSLSPIKEFAKEDYHTQ
jgi:hypothetical protein